MKKNRLKSDYKIEDKPLPNIEMDQRANQNKVFNDQRSTKNQLR